MVGKDVEWDRFYKMAEVTDGGIHGEELPVKSTVPLLGVGQLAAKEGDGGGAMRSHLLKGCSDSDVTGIRMKLKAGISCWE